MRSPLLIPLAALALQLACANDVEEEHGAVMGAAGAVDATDDQAMTTSCASGATIKGIDVSYYQENIDWAQVRADGVEFAFIRVSDGVGFADPKFERNWTEARAKGVRRGAYQFFRSNESPEAQADLLISKIGRLEAGDLPPVIDVETTDGQRAATIRDRVGRWVARVEAALGVRPIIYTGPYFWRDRVASADFVDHPLWIAHYGTECPLVPAPWTRWTFHQHSDSGRVRGIRGKVDMNLFSGSREQLAALAVAESGPAQPAPQPVPPPDEEECATVPPQGRIIDDGSACFVVGGDPRWLQRVTNRGHGGDLVKTGTTSAAVVENFGEWHLSFQEGGTYEIEVYIDDVVATSRQARYRITHADGTTDAIVDQANAAGFVSLGAYRFQAGGNQKLRLNDNTGEASSLGRSIVFDALRVTRLDDSVPPPVVDECPRLEVYGTGTVLNVRPEPNTTRPAIAELEDGDIVDRLATVTGQVIDGNTTWHYVTNGAVTGYVSDAFVRCTQ